MPQVKIRVWQGKMGDTEVALDVDLLTLAMARIWEAHGVDVTRRPDIRPVTLRAVAPGTVGTVAEAQILEDLAAPINAAKRESTNEPRIDVVYLPLFFAWGKGYTPLTPPGGKAAPSFGPFDGPTVIVTTDESIGGAGVRISRTTQAWPIGRDKPPAAKDNPVLATATANDLAHEMGHLFGLWHTTEPKRPGRPTMTKVPRLFQYLIDETVYNRPVKLKHNTEDRLRTETEARAIMANTPGTQNVPLGRDDEWFVAVRGTEIHPDDLAVVHGNIESGKYLTG